MTRRIAFVYGTTIGVGGLGVQAGNALRALAASGADLHAIGPGHHAGWNAPKAVTWHVVSRPRLPLLSTRPFRRYAGRHQLAGDRRLGEAAASRLDEIGPDLCYAFTQVALETLAWAQRHHVPGVLESPNGHIAGFRKTYVDEATACCGSAYLGHPAPAMVRRVEREYEVASHIRVSSEWSKASIANGGIDPQRITSLQQPVDLDRYEAPGRTTTTGPLRACFVGQFDLRKGFVYLLRAARGVDVSVEMVGGTGDRCCATLLAREGDGLRLTLASGDPRPALRRADIFVLPTLEDGSPFAAAEAMASSLPVITTTSTGAAEWVQEGRTGWLVPPRSAEALANALVQARDRRLDLPEMGQLARRDTEARVAQAEQSTAEWIRRLF
jgi:glycosyltransferase involved in cell wall biosynthesis